MVFGKSDESFVMNRCAPAATAVARCTASAARSVWADPSAVASSARASSTGSKVEAPEQCRQSLDLGHGAVTHRLREQLRDQEDRTDTGDCTGRRRRFDGEAVAHPSSQRVAGCGRKDQDIGIEGILRRLVTG